MDVEAQVGSVRRRRSRAQVERVVAQYEASGLRRSEFCRAHAISLSTLNRYLKRRRSAQAEAVGVNLLAVELSGARPPERTGDSGLAVVLPAGRRIEVARGFDAQTLLQLLGLLERF